MSALSDAVNALRLAAADVRDVRAAEDSSDDDESAAVAALLDAVDDVIGAWAT